MCWTGQVCTPMVGVHTARDTRSIYLSHAICMAQYAGPGTGQGCWTARRSACPSAAGACRGGAPVDCIQIHKCGLDINIIIVEGDPIFWGGWRKFIRSRIRVRQHILNFTFSSVQFSRGLFHFFDHYIQSSVEEKRLGLNPNTQMQH